MIKQLLAIDKTEPLTDKEFLTQISVCIVSIVLCLAAMAYCALALFSHAESENYVSVAQMFDLEVSAPDVCEQLSKNTYRVVNQADTPLDCEFSVNPKTEQLGYCRVMVINGSDIKKFYTNAISSEQKLVITIPAENSVTLKFVGQFGSCALPRIQDKITLN